MPSPLSLYTAKILREHPLGVWSLDDSADYVSILSNSNKNILTWSTPGSTVTTTTTQDTPVPKDTVFRIDDQDVVANNVHTIRSTSLVIANLLDFDKELATFSLSSFFYSSQDSIISIKLGISYEDPTYGTYDIFKRFPVSVGGKWMFLSETFDVPENIDADYRVFFEIEYLSDSQASPGLFLVNGLSLGQWSEEFNSHSSGVVPEAISESIYGIPSGTKGVKLLGSAEATKDGYVLTDGNRILARSFGIPLVYGSESSSFLYKHDDLPSIIIPGLGMMNDVGKNKNYSLEFWMRINSSATVDTKIVGPIASSDGIYVNGPFLKLKVGDNVVSHFVGEWYRPMLVHVSISAKLITLFLNGEDVGSIEVNRSTLNFPLEVVDGKQTDWLGFYASDEVTPFEVDCISIYTYNISSTIAKRRWLYGQAVENPDSLNTAYGGKTAYIDYDFSKYANNYNYPKTSSWANGVVNNLDPNGQRLSLKKYKLPSIVSPEQTSEEVLLSNKSLQNEDFKFISLPEDSYIYFDSINPLQENTESIYGIFKIKDSISQRQTIFKVKDALSGDSLTVYANPGSISYELDKLGVVNKFAETVLYYPGEKFAIGLNFSSMSNYFGNDVTEFLSKRGSLSLYVGGTSNEDTFTGNIYSISFANSFEQQKIADYFAPNGLVWDTEAVVDATGYADAGLYSTTFWQYIYDGGSPADHANIGLLENNISSYTLKPFENSSTMYLDVSVKASWTDNLPMSYFGKYVKNVAGGSYYDLDFIQFNIGYPAPGKFLAVQESDESWTYQQLAAKFSSPSQKKYSDLDNHLYTGYIDYTDLQHNARQTYRYDTSESLVKTYVYFKETASGMSNSSAYYTNIVSPSRNGMVQPGPEWVNTKYEVVDDMIIYPPSGINFSMVSMFTEIDVVVDGVSDKPIAIDTLQLASVSLNDAYETPIGTKYGVDIYPYTKNGFYYDYKSKNPFSIYKGSTPHLYLTRNSGIRLRGDFDSKINRGIEIPVNKEGSSNHQMIAMQMFVRFDDDFFPYSPTEVFEIESGSTHIKFFMESTHPDGKRAKIYGINVKTGQLENGIGYYVNGNIVKEPVLTVKQWVAVGIGLANYIDFSVDGGAIRITGPLTVNNLSHYNSVRLQQVQQVSTRQWFKVKESGRLRFDWKYWDGLFKWFEVLIFSSRSFYGVDPSDIYKSYVGTTRLIIDDKSILRSLRHRYRVISDSTTKLFTINAV